MSPQELAALLWRHLVAIAVILTVAAAIAYHYMHGVRGYADTATVAFVEPSSGGLFRSPTSLLVIDEVAANTVMGASGMRQVINAGGQGSYDLALVNLNNQDFPYYGVPYVTVTTTAPRAAGAASTMSAVLKVLQQDVASLQARQGAKPDTWIGVRVIANPTGPIAQTGSRKRALAGLALLTLVAAYLVARFLDRRPVRPRDVLRAAARAGASRHDWRARPPGPRSEWPHILARPSIWRR